MGTMIRRYELAIPLLLLPILLLTAPVAAHAQAVDVHGVVDALLGK
jgi:hypothetical protein